MLALAALATPALAQTGICGRTAVVQTFILAKIEGVSACADVTGTHLAAITGSLLLNSESITALAAGDFAGLTSLTNLYLNHNELTALPSGVFDGLTALRLLRLVENGLITLPAGVFDELTALRYLYLHDNALATLPAGVFAGLTALTDLTLFDNVLIALPADVFEPLTSLTILQLQRNDLATLPAGVFDALTALTDLQLHSNDLTTLPADVFEPLTSLTNRLYLDDNPGAPFAPVAVALPDDGTVSSAGGTVRLDGRGSDGGPWGEYVTYSWALTNPSSGVTVTFDDAGSATPVVTIPALAANTELTFTLTVAGRSGSDGVTRGTDAARVTATTVPGAPTGLTATASGTTAINLSWSAPASTGGSAITGYKIESSSDGGSSWSDLVANTSNTTTTYAHTGLTAGDTRHYRVSAINANGTGVPSNVANATTGATAPGAPTGLTATASGTTAINLSWSAPASTGGSAITGYNIEVSPNGTSGWTDQVANTGNANTTYAHTGLTAGTTRHYRVSAINANGTGVPSNVDSATTGTTVPGAPTGLTATASGTTQIDLSWSAPASTGGSAITGYKIESSSDGGSSWSDLVANTSNTTTTYAHTGLTAGTTRHYRVSAINANGTGVPSNVANATTGATAPGAPTGLTATASGTTAINLSWSAPASTGGSAITGYNIEVRQRDLWLDRPGRQHQQHRHHLRPHRACRRRHPPLPRLRHQRQRRRHRLQRRQRHHRHHRARRSDRPHGHGQRDHRDQPLLERPGEHRRLRHHRLQHRGLERSGWTDQVANTNSTATTYAHTGLAAGDTRHYRVSAINANGAGTASNVDSATTGTTVPGAPTGLTATASGTTAINLSWSAPASTGGSAITGYNIEVSPNGTSGWTDQVANTNSTATTYAHTGLAAGDTRHYRVSAINANGAGTASNVDSATTGTTVPGAPTGLTATASGTTAINLSWSAPASTGGSAITGYKIEVSPDGSSWSDLVADTGSTDTAYAHMGLDPATTRHYRVSTINAVGTSDASDSASTTTASTNTAATGAPTITGTAQVGQVLTATVGTIADVDGLPDPFFSDAATTIAWIRVATDNTETNIASATASTYTLGAADLGTTIKVRVSFTDDASNAETLTSAATAAVSAAPNTAATGAPTITGTAQVGQTLTAGTTAIVDADGLTSVSYTYQWIRVATDNTETNIASATASTYTLVAADLGTTIKVRVSFTDDASNAETLTSAATAAVAAAANTLATGAPTITGTAQVGQTLTAGTTAIMDADGLTAVQAIGLYKFQWIRVATDNSETNIASATVTYTLVAADQGTTIKVTVSFTDDASNPETLTSAATAAVAAAPNTPATGAPTITGTATVGQTLTAGTTAIMDADGLTNVSYTYQWIWVDGGTETNISGATASTYTLVAADQGTTIKVTVSFTDDASNPETLTSAATAAVAAEVTGTPEPEPFEVDIVGVPEVAVTGESYELTVQSDEDSLVYAWRVDGGAIEPDDVQMVVWTAPETAGVAWIHVDVTREDGATAGQSAYVRVEVPEPEPEPVPALPLLGQLLLALGLAGAGAMRLVRSARRP